MSRDGHIELDWAVDAIRVGPRARQDLGDLAPLIESIRTGGLLQPITISPDGVLLCGARRLAAVKALGHRVVSVWVRSGVSTRLERLVAEQDENTVRQPLLPTEAAALYRELRQILTDDAARRREAARFGGGGAADLAEPAKLASGPVRTRAARMVTGANSYTTLERVGRVQQIAEDPTVADGVRAVAVAALGRMDTDGKVDGHYRRVVAAVEDDRRHRLTVLAERAITQAATASDSGSRSAVDGSPARPSRQLGVRAFLLTWNELSDWVCRYDPASIGVGLTEAQWAVFTRTVQDTVDFRDRAQHARTSRL